jgi:penicillin-binding protein 2
MNEFHSELVRERAGRARLILGGAFLLLLGSFFRIQVVEHERFRLRAESNRLRPVPMTAARGVIYDRNGAVIAETVPGYSVALLASREDSLRSMLARFSRLVPLDSGDVDDVVARYREAKYQPAQVLGNASQVEVSKLEEHRAELPGLVVQSEPRRIYPRGRAVAHLVGYVGEVSEKDLSSDRFPGAALGVLVGRAPLPRGGRPRPAGPGGRRRAATAADTGRPDPHHDRSAAAAVHRQHLAGGSPRRDGGHDPRRRDPGLLLGAGLRSQ